MGVPGCEKYWVFRQGDDLNALVLSEEEWRSIKSPFGTVGLRLRVASSANDRDSLQAQHHHLVPSKRLKTYSKFATSAATVFTVTIQEKYRAFR